MMCNDEIEYNDIYFSIEIDVFKDKKEKMNGYVSIPQIQEEAMEKESEWYTWTNNGYVNRIEYPSIEFGHKYMEWIDLITETIFMYEIGDGLTVIRRKDIKISVSSNEEDYNTILFFYYLFFTFKSLFFFISPIADTIRIRSYKYRKRR